MAAAYVIGLKVPEHHVLEATVRTRGRSPRSDIRLHQGIVLPPSDYHRMNGMIVTTATRTLIDLAPVLTEEQLEIAVDDAFRRRLSSLKRLEWQAERCLGKGRAGSEVVRRIIEARRSSRHKDSGLETRMARALRHSALPPPIPQYTIRGDAGVARVDFAWPEAKVALECESYQWHSGRVEWKFDVTRLNELAALGWIVLRGTGEDADAPQGLIQPLSRLIAERTGRV